VLHAHQKGLIHRDLKPGNILVSRGQDQPATVKIIDFGVAKSLSGVLKGHGAHTRLGSFVGTPAYSSPEQVSGPLVHVDTRADIYSLGVVLYQLLAGVTPYSEEDLNRKTQAELARLLSTERAPSLLARFSSLSVEDEGEIARHRSLSVEQMKALLGSDLSWIVGKCLQSDPDDRYASVLELEKDLRRWLSDQPVEARPASRMYRMRKFVRRHRVGVALASTMTLILLTTTTAAVIGFMRAEDALKAAREATAEAKAATAEAEMAADFQVKQMQSIDPAAMGLSLRSALIEAVGEQDPGGGDSPAAAAQRRQQQEALLKRVNMTDLALNQLDTNSFQPALAAIEKDFGKSPLLQARLWETMSDTLLIFGRMKEAIEPQRLALEQRRRLLGASHPSTLFSFYGLGYVQYEIGEYKEAEANLRAATAGLRRALGDDHPHTLLSIRGTAFCLKFQGKLVMAEPLFRETYERQRRTLGNGHVSTLQSARDLAIVLAELGKYKEALPYAEASVNGFRRVALAAHDHQGISGALASKDVLSSLYMELGRYAESEALSREAVEESSRLYGENSSSTIQSKSILADTLDEQGRHSEAEIYNRQALESARKVLGDENEDVLYRRLSLAITLDKQGKKSEAETMLRDAIAELRRLFGEDHINTSDFKFTLAYVLRDQGKLDEAETTFTQVVTSWRRSLGNENRYTLDAMSGMASVLRKKGKVGEAKSMLQDVLKVQRRTLGDLDEDTLESIGELAAVARAEGDPTRAETLLREALAGYRQMRGNEHADTLKIIEQLIDLLRENGAQDEAAALELELKKSKKRAPGINKAN
jgi:tetratricopeptide (TPR) repeat protein